jgi:hypothetical protein
VEATRESDKGRPHKRKNGLGAGLWLFMAVLIIAAAVYLGQSQEKMLELLTLGNLWTKVGSPVIRTTVFISFGLLAGQLIESLGWTTRLGKLVWPLIRWARLPGSVGSSFTAAFVSGVLANTILYTGWQEGRLTKRGLVLGNLLNSSIPAYVLHMPTTMVVIISLTGQAGLLYVVLTFTAAWLRLALVAGVSRSIMPPCEACVLEPGPAGRSLKEVWRETWPKFKVRLRRLILIIVPVYLVVVVVAESGFFTWLRDVLTAWVTISFIPVESMSVVVFSVVAEFTSGFAAAGALLQAGTLSVKEVVLALLIGNIIATPVRTLRHQLPHYMGIFTPGLGMELLVVSQTVRVLSILVVGAFFVALY